MIDINYNTVGNDPFFVPDAWKIEEVGIILEFKDKNGNAPPEIGSKNFYLPVQKYSPILKNDSCISKEISI